MINCWSEISGPLHSDASTLAGCIKVIAKNDVNIQNVQKSVWVMLKRLWPSKKKRPTLYSFRHQFGSDLKASGLEREAMSYLMGHQCTSSIDSYGDRRAGKGRQVKVVPVISLDEINKQVRKDHLSSDYINNTQNNIKP